MKYLTGDTHGRFDRIGYFCERMHTSRDDILIILGDAGINFHTGAIDTLRKAYLSRLPITLLCIHGNHERCPETLKSYYEQEWRGGMVFVEDGYQNILFAKDGEVYDLDGKKAIAIGGAYSIDKARRIEGQSGWADEQPSPAIKARVENALDLLNWQIDIVLSHTTPLKYEPVEVFFPGIDQSKLDKSTEEWLDGIEDRLEYEKWYCGHYHTEKKIDRLQIMFNDFTALEADNLC